MSGRAKARREAKAADRVARGKQRAQAELTRRWHLTLAQSRQVDTAYSRAAAELVAAALRRDAVDPEDEPFSTMTLAQEIDEEMLTMAVASGSAFTDGREVYEPHCVMQWAEQVAAMDETAGRGKTGWPAGLLQDDCSELSRWFASRVDARRTVRDALEGDAK